MKLTILIMTVFLLQVSATSRAQISLTAKQESLRKVLDKISQQSGYDFVYNDQALDKAKPVTLKLDNASIQTALKGAFEGQPLVYELSDKTVMIKKKEASFFNNTIARFQAIDVKGRVLNEKNEPLAGATVSVKGKGQVAKTDAEGNFYLQNVDEKSILEISFVGFKTFEIRTKEDVGIVILKLEDNSLEQVQIVAYGEVKQKFATNNAVTIKSDQIANQPVSNPLIALAGRAPGLFIKQTNGYNTGRIDVTIQGKNSLNNGNEPFYVIDGVPFTPSSLGAVGITEPSGTIRNGAMSNLSFLNPNEIESITILKDADATAIYGSRAANGAILITTKRGKSGQTRVNLNLQTGWGKVAVKPKMMTTDEYLAIRKEAYINNNNQPIPASAIDVNGTWDEKRNVDWQREFLNGSSTYQNVQASVSGGSDHTQFLAGASYIRETPIFKGKFSNVRTSVNFNINHASNDDKFKLYISGSYLEGVNVLPTDDIVNRTITLAPNFPDLYNADGSINWAPANAPSRTYQGINEHPGAILLRQYTDKANNLVSSSNLSYEIVPGLTIKSTFGYNNLSNDEVAITPSLSLTPQNVLVDNIKPFSKFSIKSIKSWIIEPQATYTKAYSFGTFDALLGSTFQRTSNKVLSLVGTQYTNDAQLKDLNAAGVKSTEGSIQSEYNYSAIFARLNYRLRDKYILNLAARRDGSSRFGSENLFNNFYSIGGAWLFSEEHFSNDHLPFLTYGKLRASYGTTGNDQIGDYQFYSLYMPIPIDVSYLGVPGISPTGLSNPFLQWEETKKLNFGLDLGVLSNKVLFSVNHFRNRSSNQLLTKSLSVVTGFTGITRNLPALVQNTGWEFSLSYNLKKGKAFSWSSAFNITLPKNRLLRYDGLENQADRSRLQVGESINMIRVYEYIGVNSQTGLYEVRNFKGEPTSTPDDPADKIKILNLDPKWYGGFSNTVTYKNFSLDLFFQFMSQMGGNQKFYTIPGVAYNQNILDIYKDHWRQPGELTEFQKVTANTSEIRPAYTAAFNSDAAYSQIRILRLNNASLSYNFSPQMLKDIHITNARLFVQGQNLFTVSNYKISDPEILNFRTLGLRRIFTLGAQVGF